MTATTAPPATQVPAAGWLRRHRAALVIVVGLVAATTFSALGQTSSHSGVDDPENTGKEGARALAQVLGDQGVDVTVVRGADAFDATRLAPGTTVVVTSTENLGPTTARRLQEHARGVDLVLVEPRFSIADLFGVRDSAAVLKRTRTTASCGDSRFDGLDVDVDAATAYPGSASPCFPTDAGPLLVTPRPSLTLLGSTDLISNDQITRADNAAVALRTLGGNAHLVWYVPDVDDLTGSDGVSFTSLLPRWLGPGLLLAAIAMLTVLWWRGRRLGRLAVEPLPVVVTAIESTLSRARLYRKVNDRAHAATALRTAARRRLAEHLGLSRGAADDVAGLVRDLAPYTALDDVRLRSLLAPDAGTPASDHDLIHLANDLADLMREVRRP